MDGSERERYWRAWKTHCRLFPQAGNKWANVVTDQLLTFAVAGRKDSTVSELRSRFSQSKGLSGMLPKGLFWTDIPTPDMPPLPSNRLTSPLPV